MKPKLIIIQGAPASGKTTISRELIKRLPGVVLISKDDIKEFLFDTQPTGGRDWSRTLGRASIAAMYAMAATFLADGRVVMLESAFDSRFASADIKALDADVVEVYCRTSPAILERRFVLRAAKSRHPGHCDSQTTYDGAVALRQYVSLAVGMSLEVQTDEPVQEEHYRKLTKQITDFLEDN